MEQAAIDWSRVRRVLVVRLRSIGDTVLSTPSLIALKRFLPEAKVDVLLEDWVAPVLDGFDAVDDVLTVGAGAISKLAALKEIRRRKYDVVLNLHGGTTATFFSFASGARHRVGYEHYQYSFLYNHLLSSAADFWKREKTHSAEQQLALLGFVGVPVDDRPKSRLAISEKASDSLEHKFYEQEKKRPDELGKFALIHPAAAFKTKEWPSENFARTAEFLREQGLSTVAVAAKDEQQILENVRSKSGVPIHAFNNFTLPEITALASKAALFVGNDSGIAHIAAAVGTPSVVIFGSSNRDHWSPWTDAPNEIVFEEFPCQPCPGHECAAFDEPQCILTLPAEKVFAAIERVLNSKEKAG